MGRTHQLSRSIAAPAAAVYQALTDPDDLVDWLPPHGMTGRFERFDPRPGGGYRLVLTYDDPAAAQGKSTDDADIAEVRYVEIVDGVRVVQAVEFESVDPAFAGIMLMTWEVVADGDGCRITLRADDVPAGISERDHLEGFGSSLDQLQEHLRASRQADSSAAPKDTENR